VHGKVLTFRAPAPAAAAAVETLRHLGVNCVTLENNHALDYGPDALQDTLAYLREAGIATREPAKTSKRRGRRQSCEACRS
jgi:poly-gamma-glutamate capsule biosynthesis protein CapA/YwtB (metallophosphatase superfamily)